VQRRVRVARSLPSRTRLCSEVSALSNGDALRMDVVSSLVTEDDAPMTATGTTVTVETHERVLRVSVFTAAPGGAAMPEHGCTREPPGWSSAAAPPAAVRALNEPRQRTSYEVNVPSVGPNCWPVPA
jgi:hypothetical protein